jgi:DNA-binding transcriptional LysR family regulator
MDFDQLTTFVEVAKLGSFSRAGEKVFRSQSAVSAQIRQLEEVYGEKLLDRSGKSVRLTPAGEVLFDYAVRLLRLRDESQRAVADQSATPRGVLVVGANEATCLYVLPDVFAEYHRLYPEVQVSIYRNFSRKVLQRLEEGAIDVGIVTMPVKSPSLKDHAIYRDRLMLMVSSGNPLSERKSIRMEEIASQPLIFPKTGFTRQLLDKYFRPYRSQLRVTMELPSVGMIKRFVAANLGVSLISEGFTRDQVQSGEVKLIEIEDVKLWRELGVVYRRDRSLPATASAFITLVRNRRLLDAAITAPPTLKAVTKKA